MIYDFDNGIVCNNDWSVVNSIDGYWVDMERLDKRYQRITRPNGNFYIEYEDISGKDLQDLRDLTERIL